MIKAAIMGADSPRAGELIRILVNHPDVEIVSLVAPGKEGMQARAIHHGLLGEQNFNFSSSLLTEGVDVVFFASSPDLKEIEELRNSRQDLRIIILPDPTLSQMECSLETEREETDPEGDQQMVYGLPEIYRKRLVRGSRVARIPHPFASPALVALYPLAAHMLLSDDIEIRISAPEDMTGDDNLTAAAVEVKKVLEAAQKSFAGNVTFVAAPAQSKRGVELSMAVPSPLGLEFVLNAYDIYDDHNFAYAVASPASLDDVKGTEKCIVSLDIPEEGRLQIHAVADGRLRGSAGEAVHVMNLLFGLHEKTGLYLKPYAY